MALEAASLPGQGVDVPGLDGVAHGPEDVAGHNAPGVG